MQTENGGKPANYLVLWSIPLLLCVISIVVMGAGNEAASISRYERAAIMDGEIWRVFTAHLAHLGWSHLLLNLVGLGIIWLLCGRALPTGLWLLVLFSCALGVSGGLLIFNPGLVWYVGLSGILHGIIVAGAMAGIYKGDGESGLILLLVVGKLGWEQWHGPMPGSEATAGGSVVVDAHLYGAVSALLLLVALLATPAGRKTLLKAKAGD